MHRNALDYDLDRHVTKEKYENDLEIEHGYTEGGYMKVIMTKDTKGSVVRRLGYEHDEGGNLVSPGIHPHSWCHVQTV